MKHTVFIFGEAEKGEFCSPYLCNSVSRLSENFGTTKSKGIYKAVEALLHGHDVLYFRVEEEGFSREDYYEGFHFLSKDHFFGSLSALCLPGVGDPHILKAASLLSLKHKSLLIVEEKDLFDFLIS